MSTVPIVASIAELPAAIRHAEHNVGSRAYVARRAVDLGHGDVVPASWGVVAAGPSQKTRDKMAKKGQAMDDGSFPIANRSDLKKAIQAYGRAGDKAAAKRHIIKRARALGALSDLPDDWNAVSSSGALTAAGWDENLHPRDRNGKYIEKFGLLRIFEGAGFTKASFSGRAIGSRHTSNGDIITVQALSNGHTSGGREVHMGDEVDVNAKDISAAPPVKAKIVDAGRDKFAPGDVVRVKDTGEEFQVLEAKSDGSLLVGDNGEKHVVPPSEVEMVRRQPRAGEAEAGVPVGETPTHPSAEAGRKELATGVAKFAAGDQIQVKDTGEKFQVLEAKSDGSLLVGDPGGESHIVDPGDVQMLRRVARPGETAEGPSKMPSQTLEDRTITSPKVNQPGANQPKLDEASSAQLDQQLRDSLKGLGINPDDPTPTAPTTPGPSDTEKVANAETMFGTDSPRHQAAIAKYGAPGMPDTEPMEAPDPFDTASSRVDEIIQSGDIGDPQTAVDSLQVASELDPAQKKTLVDRLQAAQDAGGSDDLSSLSDEELKSRIMDAAVNGDNEALTKVASEIASRKAAETAPAPSAEPDIGAAPDTSMLDQYSTGELASDWQEGDASPSTDSEYAKAVLSQAALYQGANLDNGEPDTQLDNYMQGVKQALESGADNYDTQAGNAADELRSYLNEQGYTQDSEMPDRPDMPGENHGVSDSLDETSPLTPEEQAFEAPPEPDGFDPSDLSDIADMADVFEEGADNPADYADEFPQWIQVAHDSGNTELEQRLSNIATDAGLFDNGDSAPDLKGNPIDLGSTDVSSADLEQEFPTVADLQSELEANGEADPEWANILQEEIDRRNAASPAPLPSEVEGVKLDPEGLKAYSSGDLQSMAESGKVGTDNLHPDAVAAVNAEIARRLAPDANVTPDNGPGTPAPPSTSDTGQAIPNTTSAEASAIRLSLGNSAAGKGIDAGNLDQRLGDVFGNPDQQQGHKDMAKIMTELKLGGKQRARLRQLLDKHYGNDGSSSAQTEAATVAQNLSPDNPLKEALAAKAGVSAPAAPSGKSPDVDLRSKSLDDMSKWSDAEIEQEIASLGAPSSINMINRQNRLKVELGARKGAAKAPLAPAAPLDVTPAPGAAGEFTPPTGPGDKLYRHPMGASIVVHPNGSMEAYGKDGGKKSTSATPGKLAAGHGQWVEVPAQGPAPSATPKAAPTAPTPNVPDVTSLVAPPAPSELATHQALSTSDAGAQSAAKRLVSDLIEHSFEDPGGPWGSYASAAGAFELADMRRASIEDDLATNSNYVTIKVPGGSEVSLTPQDAREMLAALDQYGSPQAAASAVGKA